MATTASSAQAFHFVSLFGASSIAALVRVQYIIVHIHMPITQFPSFDFCCCGCLRDELAAVCSRTCTHTHIKSVAETRIFAQWRALVHRTWPCQRKLYDIDSFLPPHKNRSSQRHKTECTRKRARAVSTEFDISRKQQHFFLFAIGQQTL